MICLYVPHQLVCGAHSDGLYSFPNIKKIAFLCFLLSVSILIFFNEFLFCGFFFSVFLLSISLICWAQWHMPVNPNPREAELRSCLSHRVGSLFEIFFFEFSLLSLLFPFMFLFCNYSACFLASSPGSSDDLFQTSCFNIHIGCSNPLSVCWQAALDLHPAQSNSPFALIYGLSENVLLVSKFWRGFLWELLF